VLAAFAFFAWWSAKDQLKEMHDQTTRLQSQVAEMQADKRPWIGVSTIMPIDNKWPKRDNDQVECSLGVVLRNVGRSAAIVHVKADLVPTTSDWRNKIGPVCAAAKADIRQKGWGERERWMVIPNDEWPFHLYGLKLADSVARIQKEDKGQYRPMVVGCVVYSFGNNADLWSTGFVGLLSVEERATPTERDHVGPLDISDREPPQGKALYVKAISMVDVAD
jgi:hypothetical protein